MSYNVVMPTVYGPVIMNKNERYYTPFIRQHGFSYDHDEIYLMRKVLHLCLPDPVVIDVGAHIGLVTLGLRDLAAQIHAFEAQRIIWQMLVGNLALNSVENVRCYHVALGAKAGRLEIPKFDYGKYMAFGCVRFGRDNPPDIGQVQGQSTETVEARTLDSFNFQRVDLLKCDVEHMDGDVMVGATETIMRCRPAIFVEVNDKANADAIAALMSEWDYDVWHHKVNWLCAPVERELPARDELVGQFMKTSIECPGMAYVS